MRGEEGRRRTRWREEGTSAVDSDRSSSKCVVAILGGGGPVGVGVTGSSSVRNRSCSLAGHEEQVFTHQGHPFLSILASGSLDASVIVWDLESRSPLHTLRGHEDYIFDLAFDPTGRRLASASEDCAVRIWDLDSGVCVRVLEGHEDGVGCVAWDASGAFIASGSRDKRVRVWDAASGALLHSLDGHNSPVHSLATHPTDDLFASGASDESVRVWRWSSGACTATLRGHSGPVYSLAASASFIVSGSGDAIVRVWTWTAGPCIRVIDNHGEPVGLNALAWCGASLVVLEAEDWNKVGAVFVWDTSEAERPSAWKCLGSFPGKPRSSLGVSLLHDGRVVCGAPGSSTSIAVWRAR